MVSIEIQAKKINSEQFGTYIKIYIVSKLKKDQRLIKNYLFFVTEQLKLEK